MPRTWVWLQLIIGWLPVWALYATLIVTAHPGSHPWHALFTAFRAILAAALLGLGVQRLARRYPWPHPFRASFMLVHLVAAAVYAHLWVLLVSAMESLFVGQFVIVAPAGIASFLVLGVWLYVMVAGVSYATTATERAALAEALAARSQLAALRGQLNPHFLFNALHTVVQLIPREPRRASQAAEQLAGLLRTAVEEDRDLVSLSDEWAFVERYLELERIRFGDRLRVVAELPDDARGALVPSFALQTLVENAVRHGAAPKVEPTEIRVTAARAGDTLTLTVRDNGVGADPASVSNGTGLQRLRERLAAHYGVRSRLDVESGRPGMGGFTATLTIPQEPAGNREAK